VRTFAASDADLITAITMTYGDEAIGLSEAARAAAMPVVISFTVETDGRLPSGEPLGDAMAQPRGVGAHAPAWKPRHAELDEAETLDSGDPRELAERYRELRALASNLRVLGGCCGTDYRHIDAISLSCRPGGADRVTLHMRGSADARRRRAGHRRRLGTCPDARAATSP
jgi:S-methylmethionine-dependent homocysteine/selenocysteine methylase